MAIDIQRVGFSFKPLFEVNYVTDTTRNYTRQKSIQRKQ